MLNNHLTEEDVQQYVIDQEGTDASIISHVQRCEACMARVATYQLIFTALAEQPAPSFDFDLSELVMAKLPSPKPSASKDNLIGYLFALAVLIPGALLFYLFRKDLSTLLPDSTPFVGYLVIPLAVTVMVLLCIDMYKTYHRKMTALDFY